MGAPIHRGQSVNGELDLIPLLGGQLRHRTNRSREYHHEAGRLGGIDVLAPTVAYRLLDAREFRRVVAGSMQVRVVRSEKAEPHRRLLVDAHEASLKLFTEFAIRMQVPKVRRGGRKGEFTLQVDRERCLFDAVDVDGSATALAHDKALDDLATRILEILRKYPDGLNVTAIRGSLRPGPGERGARHDRVSAALARLKAAGAAKETTGERRSTVWRAVSGPKEDSSGDD